MKQGLDDFLACGGDADELILKATPAGELQTNAKTAESRICQLAELSALEYETVRQAEAESLDVRVSALDKFVAQQREKLAEAALAPEPPVWAGAVDGAALLDEIIASLRTYLILPPHAAEAIALWILHTWCFDVAAFAPRIALTSPEPRCGKTQVLSFLSMVVARGLAASNFTAAVIFRMIDLHQPTVLLDEVDTFLPEHDELRGILNSGHAPRLAFVFRCVGDEHEPKKFSTWVPMAVGLIGKLPRTLQDRSIEIRMRRRLKTEQILRLRDKDLVAIGAALAPKCARWAQDNIGRLKAAEPVPPEALNDRQADSWDPLFAIADVVGGEWPDRDRQGVESARDVRKAAREIALVSRPEFNASFRPNSDRSIAVEL